MYYMFKCTKDLKICFQVFVYYQEQEDKDTQLNHIKQQRNQIETCKKVWQWMHVHLDNEKF